MSQSRPRQPPLNTSHSLSGVRPRKFYGRGSPLHHLSNGGSVRERPSFPREQSRQSQRVRRDLLDGPRIRQNQKEGVPVTTTASLRMTFAGFEEAGLLVADFSPSSSLFISAINTSFPMDET